MSKFELIDNSNGLTNGNRFALEIEDKILIGISTQQGGALIVRLTDAQLEALAEFLNIYIWNAAIDKCIEVANKYDSYGPAYEMRMLKK